VVMRRVQAAHKDTIAILEVYDRMALTVMSLLPMWTWFVRSRERTSAGM